MAPVEPQPEAPVAPSTGPTLLQRLEDVGERLLSTFILTFVGLLAVSGIGDVDGIKVAASAGVAAAFSLLKNIVQNLADSTNGGVLWKDALLRTFSTYIGGFLGLVVVNQSVDFGNSKAYLIAAAPAALTILKSYVGQFIGNQNTAGWLPATVPVMPPTPVLPVAG